MKYIFSLLLFVSISANSQVITDTFPVTSWGTKRAAFVYTPTTYNLSAKKYPLIIFLHGAGEAGNDITRLRNTALPQRIVQGWVPSATHPLTGVVDTFIVVAPQAETWSYDYTQLKHVLPAVLKKYRIDETRIYLTGLSAGGGGTFTVFGSKDSSFISKFSAMATASSAGVNAANNFTSAQIEQNLSFGTTYGSKIWAVTGELDLRSNVQYINLANRNAPAYPNKLTIITGVGHSAWNQLYNPSFRPVFNYYGNSGSCNNGCNNGGVPVAPNNNGSTIRGSGKTQDSLNVYEWFLLQQKGTIVTTTPPTASAFVNAGDDAVVIFPTTCYTLKGSSNIKTKWIFSPLRSTYLTVPTIAQEGSLQTNISCLFPGTYVFLLMSEDPANPTLYDEVTITVKCECTQ